MYITSRSLGRLEATAAAIRERGGIPVPMQVDHSQQDEIEGLFKKISQDEGKLDILVNNCFAAIDGIFNSETRGMCVLVFTRACIQGLVHMQAHMHMLNSTHTQQA